MSRRAIYMYGALLPSNPQGGVNGGPGTDDLRRALRR